MANNIFSIILTVATLSICCSKQASTQERRYSLSPPLAPFPCAAVNMEGNSITFRAGIVFVCNGKDLEEMPAGSIMGINAVCDGPTLIFHHDFGQRNSLFDIVRRRCGVSRARR